MSKGCVWMPSKGQETFKKLKKEYGRPIAAVVFNKITGTQFQKLYKDSLTFDSEGVPTFESIMKIPIVRNYIGESKILESYNKDQPHLNDTTENTATLINKAYDFNKLNKDYIAVVDYDDEGKLTIKVLPNTKENNEWAKSQYNIQKLNEAVANILSPLGITIGELSKEEVAAGRVGLTNFAHAQEIANQFTGLIQVANNMEGAAAISEEFSHFIVGIFRDSPLVQRSINYLKDEKNARKVLGEQYNEVSEYYNGNADLIAEEAVGHVFRQALLDRINKTEEIKQPLFKRMMNFIVNFFKGLNPAYYQDSIDKVNRNLSQLADDILSDKKTITKQDVEKSRRNVEFNALSEKEKVQVSVLRKATERAFKAAALQENIETVRQSSARQSSREFAEKVNDAIKDKLKDEQTIAAIAAYLDLATENIEGLFTQIQNIDNLDVQNKFIVLRNALFTIQSYGPTIEELMEVTSDEYMSDESISMQDYIVENEGVSLKGTVDTTLGLYTRFTKAFLDKALPEFISFLKPFVGENIKLVNEKGDVNVVSIKKIIEESGSDVTMMQRWFSSMADNPDALLQIFDYVVKKAKDEHRIKTIEKAQEIIALGKEYEAKGITDYDWMYEDDKQNYINEEYDTSKYREAKKAFFATLDEKYGAHPSIGSEEYRKKRKEQQEWVRQNTIARKDTTGGFYFIPNPDKYPSRWNSLNATQKEFFNKWMELKTSLDTIIGPEHTTPTNTIKIRKSGIERIKGAMSGDAISNFVESAKAKLMKSFDDDTNYESTKGIRGFNNEEIMKLPLYYLNSKDTKDLSTDAIGTLVAYAEMAYNYEAMSKVVNPLEIGREIIIMNKRRINAKRHGKKLMEEFNFAGRTVKNPIYEDVEASNFKAMLDDFFESKIYGRYLKDAGEIAGIDTNKTASILLKLGSTVQLGFNLLANIANAATGLSMQNIEAAAGEHFSARELLKADTEFMKAMGSYVGDIGQRALKSKLALFDQMFDVRQNFKKNIKDVNFLNKTILTRIFGPGIQYIGQDAGDHWLYNRTAIAIALRHKLKDSNGKEISLWDALEVVPIDPDNPDAGNQLVLKEGVKNLDGSNFSIRDISDISGNMRYVNQHLFGIYNDEDSIGARRVIWGRFLMQYRDWIPAQFRYRFGSKTTNLEKGDMVEGYYRTTGRFIKQIYKELKNGEKTIGQVWDSLEDYERANLKRATTEVIQWLVICAMASLLGGKDKDRPWAERALGYSMVRLRTELGALVPFSMPKEMLAIARSPFAATNVLSDISSLLSLLNPMSYTDEIESGDYKGHSSAYRAFMKSPLTLWYKTIKRATQPEKAEQYYNQ